MKRLYFVFSMAVILSACNNTDNLFINTCGVFAAIQARDIDRKSDIVESNIINKSGLTTEVRVRIQYPQMYEMIARVRDHLPVDKLSATCLFESQNDSGKIPRVVIYSDWNGQLPQKNLTELQNYIMKYYTVDGEMVVKNP